MSVDKESDVSFEAGSKESFRERLARLLKGRSVNAAAQSWGIPKSTINNYLHKGTEPALKIVVAIAEAEKVDLRWLATGLHEDSSGVISRPSEQEIHDPLRIVWNMIYDSMDRRDTEALIKLIHNTGAKGVIAASSVTNDLNHTWLHLPDDEKERLLALHEAKKGASEEREVNEADNLTDKRLAG